MKFSYEMVFRGDKYIRLNQTKNENTSVVDPE